VHPQQPLTQVLAVVPACASLCVSLRVCVCVWLIHETPIWGCPMPLQAEEMVEGLMHPSDDACTTLGEYLAAVEQVCLEPPFQQQAFLFRAVIRMIRSGGEIHLMLLSRVLEGSHSGLEDKIAELCGRADAPYNCAPVHEQSGLLFSGTARAPVALFADLLPVCCQCVANVLLAC
jgi:hypothetical protein